LKKRLCSTWKITSNLRKQLKSIDKPVGKRKILKHLKDIENYWKDSNNVSQTYRRVLEWILRFKKASSGKGLPFDLPYLELYERLIRGKKFMDMIDTETDISIKRQCANLDTLIEQMDNSKDWSCQFKKSVKMLKFARKWFKKLRAVLLLGTLQDKQDPFAPLSKRYQLTEEQAKAIPKNIKGFLEEVEKAIQNSGSVEMAFLEKNMIWLNAVVTIAPMLGFMGTVIGMIDAFDKIQEQGDISPTVVAGGIKIALITTVTGLMVAIILQIFYNYLVSQIDGIVNKMEDASISLVDMLVKHNLKK